MSSEQSGIKISHGLKLMMNLEKLREQKSMSDFTIKVGSVHFDVHRTVLAACSGYFRAMLDEHIGEGVVYVKGIETKAMEACVEFMYSGETYISVDNAESIMDAAKLLQLEGLYALCLSHLKEKLNAGNCFFMKKIANLHEEQDLQYLINRFILDNMEDVIETEGFLYLSKIELLELFTMCRHMASSKSMFEVGTNTKVRPEFEPSHKSDSKIFISAPTSRKSSANSGKVNTFAMRTIKSAQVSSNTKPLYFVLWKAVTNWINYDVQERLICIAELCDSIELGRFPRTILATTVWEEPQVQASETCKNMISSIVLSHAETMGSFIDHRNCFNIYKMAIVYSSKNVSHIITKVFGFISRNLKSLKKRPEVQFWTENDICLFCKSCRNIDLNENDMWETAMTWFRFDNERRQEQCTMNILESIDVKDFSPQFVLSTVLKESFIRESVQCVEYLGRVVFYNEKLVLWNINLETCFTIKYLARTFKNSIFGIVRQHVLSFFVANFHKVATQPGFCHILFEELFHLCKILKKRNIHGEVKWMAIIKWVKFNEAKRKKHLPTLLRTISFERLSSDFIRKTVRFEQLVHSSPECNDIVMTAIYKMLP